MSTVTETTEVAVPVRTAYNQWTQFEEFPRFMEGVEEVQQRTDTLTHWVVEIGGVRREFDAQIVEQTPDQLVEWTSINGPRHAGVVTFEPLDAGHTRVTMQMEIEPTGLAESAADALGLLTRRVKGDLGRFREYIEQRGAETGAWRGEVHPPDTLPPR
jgi:uncharacterized membrane protein